MDIENFSNIWNGYCPESFLKGNTVRMRLNENDFFESEATGLQICRIPGVQAVVLNWRGNGKFRATASYADDIESGEILSPQNTDMPPFNNPATVFDERAAMEHFFAAIP